MEQSVMHNADRYPLLRSKDQLYQWSTNIASYNDILVS